jgi:hypothetical protein
MQSVSLHIHWHQVSGLIQLIKLSGMKKSDARGRKTKPVVHGPHVLWRAIRRIESAAEAALEHHFNNHDFCGGWCPCLAKSKAERAEVLWCKHRCKTEDKVMCIETAKFVDPLEWWESVGRALFPKIAQMAMIQLCVPDSNGYQERVFSKCSYFNAPQRRNMAPQNFEMQTLLSLNRRSADKLFEEKLTADVEEHKADEEDNERMSKGWQSFVVINRR